MNTRARIAFLAMVVVVLALVGVPALASEDVADVPPADSAALVTQPS